VRSSWWGCADATPQSATTYTTPGTRRLQAKAPIVTSSSRYLSTVADNWAHLTMACCANLPRSSTDIRNGKTLRQSRGAHHALCLCTTTHALVAA
jgi:hypothetical protein